MVSKRSMLLAALLVVPVALLANGIPLCEPGSLQSYIDNYAQGCIVEDKLFSNWAYVPGVGNPPPASSIYVSPLIVPLNPGFIFGLGWFAGAGQQLGATISYSVVELDPTRGIRDLSLEMGLISRGDPAEVHIWKVYREEAALHVFATPSGLQLTDSVIFTPPVWGLTIQDLILLDASHGGYVAIAGLTNQFSEVPEPLTFALIGSGLLGLGLLRRHVHKA